MNYLVIHIGIVRFSGGRISKLCNTFLNSAITFFVVLSIRVFFLEVFYLSIFFLYK